MNTDGLPEALFQQPCLRWWTFHNQSQLTSIIKEERRLWVSFAEYYHPKRLEKKYFQPTWLVFT